MQPLKRVTGLIFGAAALVTLIGCGARGLPPAGPGQGEVDTGYGGVQDERDVTGAVTSVSDDELGTFKSTNVYELLRGRAAGLEIIPKPEGGYLFRIRGISTSAAVQPEPLFIVDNVKMPGSNLESALAGLTREDIRQVEVLKDIASTSVYGIQGAGGVIIINTKRR
jgi:TonB-dependent SusC/RagA subfamily outer membrane receptor